MCWSPALGYGPSCSEWTNRDTCNGNGVVQINGTCVCSDPQVGEGPSCVEYTNKETCSDQGIAQPDGTCACYSPELGIGPDCSPELTNAASCSSAGTASIMWSWQIEEEKDRGAAAAAATAAPMATVNPLSEVVNRSSIRLVDAYGNAGPDVSRGRLELVYLPESSAWSEWSTVCDDSWDAYDGAAACRQLGFASYVYEYDAAGGAGTIRFDDLACSGTEHSLYECPKTEGSSDCSHGEDVGIQCADMLSTTSTTATRTTTMTTKTTSTATLGPNMTTTTATATTTTHTYEARCECWDTTQAYGPTCSEFVAKEVCNDNGIFGGDPAACMCGSQRVGHGDNCDEGLVSDSSRCNGKGVPIFPDGCDCFSGALGEGPTCSEYTDAVTCNGQGEVQHDGSCICYDPAVGTGPTCTEYSNAATCGVKGRHGDEKGIATPDGGCFWLCDVYHGGYDRCDGSNGNYLYADYDDDDDGLLCGKCEGGCVTDSDCLPGLLCMKRDYDDDYISVTATFTNSMGEFIHEVVDVRASTAIPGCFAHNGRHLDGNDGNDDFCYDPRDAVVHNHQMSYEEHCSQGAGKRKGPVVAAIVCSCIFVVLLCWWFCVDCWPRIRDARREKARQKGLKRVFGRANPIICRSLGGEMFPIADWAFCKDLVAELKKQHPNLVVDDGMSVALVHPDYGKVHPTSSVWRDDMLDGNISVDNIALVYERTNGANAAQKMPPRLNPAYTVDLVADDAHFPPGGLDGVEPVAEIADMVTIVPPSAEDEVVESEFNAADKFDGSRPGT